MFVSRWGAIDLSVTNALDMLNLLTFLLEISSYLWPNAQLVRFDGFCA